jgi:hypothetical protein
MKYLVIVLALTKTILGFQPISLCKVELKHTFLFESQNDNLSDEKAKKRKDVMSFLRKVGAVGVNQDFSTAMGSDEGPVGKTKNAKRSLEKSKSAFVSCTLSGVIDDMSEPFPMTSSGSTWTGFTDQVKGGVSVGKLERQTLDGRLCNVMKGKVSTFNDGGFIQCATMLSKDPSVSLIVDASKFNGIQLDVWYKGENDKENFNVHLRNPRCTQRFSSYRATFEVTPVGWQTVNVPFDAFIGNGPGAEGIPFDPSELQRLSVVAIGKTMDVNIGIGKVGFYKDS